MLKKEILAIYKATPATKFAVTKPGHYYTKAAIQNVVGIPNNKIASVVILSDQAYEYSFTNVSPKAVYDQNPSYFPLAQKGAKKTGILVYDLTLDQVWIADIATFIGEYTGISQRITAYQQAEQQREAERMAKQQAEQAARAGARDKEKQAESQMKALIESLIKRPLTQKDLSVNLNTSVEWIDEKPKPEMYGSITFDYYTMLRLANLIQDLQNK